MEEVGPGLGGRVELLSTLTDFHLLRLVLRATADLVQGPGCLRCPHHGPGSPGLCGSAKGAALSSGPVFWNAAAPVRHTDNLGDPHLHSAGPGEFAIITQGLEVEGPGRREKGRWALPSARKLGHRTARGERHMDKEVQGGMRRLEGKAGAVLLVLLILTGGGGESY